jgi:hypothetical protein
MMKKPLFRRESNPLLLNRVKIARKKPHRKFKRKKMKLNLNPVKRVLRKKKKKLKKKVKLNQ